MIGDVQADYAAAIAARLPAGVGVTTSRPDQAVGPAVWVELAQVTWRGGAFRVGVVARAIAGDGTEAVTRGDQLAALGDACCGAALALGSGDTLSCRPGTVELAGAAVPTVDTYATANVSQCAPPDPVTLGVPAHA